MKIRNIITSAVMALFVCTAASAQTTVKDVRIYINPGHGSWGGNNRHLATIGHDPISESNPDTTDFYESNTNLEKGLALLERLIDYGVPFDRTKNQTNANPNRVGAALDLSQTNIVMSRVKNGPYPFVEVNGVDPDQNNDFNRNLTTIAREVEENNFDVFISIHSNAASSDLQDVNYLAYFYRTDYGADGTKGKALCEYSWNQRIKDRHTQWTHYDYEVGEGSVKISDDRYIVCGHSVPGFLVEGYFHTYTPSRHRYMNWDVCRLEGVDYARGFADYFGWEKEDFGEIYGIVRDSHEKFTHKYYKPHANSKDLYKPLNGIDVILKDKDGKQVATYKTDENYNGAFIFRKVPVGEYTIEFSSADYKALEEPVKVTVEAAKTVYPKAWLEATNYEPPKIDYKNYPDSLVGKDYLLSEEYNVKGEEINTLAEQLTGKTVRRQIVRNNKLYVLALDAENEPYIYLVNLVEKTVTELDKAAVAMGSNGKLKISDIALTADHKLIANGMSGCHFDDAAATGRSEDRGSVNIYKWTTDEETGLPGTCELWFSTQTSSNFTYAIVGRTMSYTGTSENGKLTLTSKHGTKETSIAMRMERMIIENGEKAGEERLDTWAKGYDDISKYFYADNLSTTAEDFELMVSPLGDYNLVIDGDKSTPMEFTFNEVGAAKPATIVRNETLVNAKANGANYFKYAGKTIMVSPDVNAEGKVAGIKMFDITDGLDKAVEIKVNGTSIGPVEYTYASAHGEVAIELEQVDRDNYKTVGAEIELFLIIDGKVMKFTTKDVDQPAKPAVYAYNLAINDEESKITLKFDISGATKKADVVLTPVAGGENIVYTMGALESGSHTYVIERSKMQGDYTWSVAVENIANVGHDILYSDNSWEASADAKYNGGVAIDTNPESDFFGSVYVSTASKGIYVFDAAGEKKTETAYWTSHAGTLARGTVSNGKFYVADNSTANGGVYMLNPAKPEDINTVATGNASCAVAFKGEGETRDMYTIGSHSGAYNLLRYKGINGADTWSGSGSYVEAADAKIFGNDHHSIIATESGLLISQFRTASSDYAPAFFFIDYNGTISNYATDLQSTLNGSNKSAMALSKDKSLFAIIDAASHIQVYDVAWNSGVPAFTHKLSIPTNAGIIWQLAFDYAGNLHCYGEEAGYYVHATPRAAGDIVTPAKKSLVLTKVYSPSAIETVNSEINAPVEYYNLQGVKVANPSNGIFIKKQGSKATKVIL